MLTELDALASRLQSEHGYSDLEVWEHFAALRIRQSGNPAVACQLARYALDGFGIEQDLKKSLLYIMYAEQNAASRHGHATEEDRQFIKDLRTRIVALAKEADTPFPRTWVINFPQHTPTPSPKGGTLVDEAVSNESFSSTDEKPSPTPP
jgi:hypothetical protein